MMIAVARSKCKVAQYWHSHKQIMLMLPGSYLKLGEVRQRLEEQQRISALVGGNYLGQWPLGMQRLIVLAIYHR